MSIFIISVKSVKLIPTRNSEDKDGRVLHLMDTSVGNSWKIK